MKAPLSAYCISQRTLVYLLLCKTTFPLARDLSELLVSESSTKETEKELSDQKVWIL